MSYFTLHCIFLKCFKHVAVVFVRIPASMSIQRYKCAQPPALKASETGEDKAAFMTYVCSGLHTCSLRGSIYLLITHHGISAHIILPGIYLISQEAGGEEAFVDVQSTFDQTEAQASYLQIFPAEIPLPEKQWIMQN